MTMMVMRVPSRRNGPSGRSELRVIWPVSRNVNQAPAPRSHPSKMPVMTAVQLAL